MADRLYLSIWLKGVSPLNLFGPYEKMLAAFPYSKLAQNESNLTIYAVAYSEPPLLETPLLPPVEPEAIIRIASEFQNTDVCCEVTTYWDLWRYEKDWGLAPVPVQLTCYAPDFEHELGEHLRIDFGLESQFLPSENAPGGLAMIRGNIQSLLRLVHDLDQALPVERRLLWSESGGNFAERLQSALTEA
jgi:hypothetical protein